MRLPHDRHPRKRPARCGGAGGPPYVFSDLKDRIIAAFGKAAWVDKPGISVHGSDDGGRLAMNHSGWAALPALLAEALEPVALYIIRLRADSRSELATLRAEVEQVKAEQRAMLIQVGEHARARGEAEGALAISEKAGIVEGWRARALAAEAETTRLRAGMEAAASLQGELVQTVKDLIQTTGDEADDLRAFGRGCLRANAILAALYKGAKQ